MNSYPPELLTQLAPVMFVAGLDSPVNVPPPVPTLAFPSTTTPIPKSQDAFQLLVMRLREALLAQRKVAIWQPEKNKSFQVILVDKDVKFPPRKLIPPDDPQYSSAHSPLSPLTPTSPLHPDGVIAPIWIRKHTSLIPSVFVVFLRVFEFPQSSRSPLDLPDSEREAEERKKDTELASDVAQRKKSTNERGMKLTVVLMASRKMLDDPTLDSRLTFIRRQSGLDSRAALFVLSPVSPSELNEFVRSLQQALYEPAVEYYTAHSKRVRRKRNRHSQAVSTYPNSTTGLGGIHIARPLRAEGWTVRYEYKMACFAEFRGEDEVALKHYQDAYEMLTIMFGSTAILPPRTKRWAEAKVLADCINIKIVKLYLYNNEHSLALSHHNSHIHQFGDFSRGWGIGEETFEFWSWVARQHRILAELLEQGTRSTLVIPTHKPLVIDPHLTASQETIRPGSDVQLDSVRSLGMNPSQALQHPGFYFYMAARCTETRRERFLAAVEAELSQKAFASSPGYTNEKKVEHLAIINELYTKAYELFKKHAPAANQGQTRLTLWIAYKIAQSYYDAGKYEMAVRFFERIAKTYRREKWNAMLRPLLLTWYDCAKHLKDVVLGIKLLIELLGHDTDKPEESSVLQEDLITVLKSAVPTSPDTALEIDLPEARPIFDSETVFWSPEIKVGEQVAFQLSLTAPSSVAISSISFSRMTINFSECAAIVVEHEPSESTDAVRIVRLGHISSSEDIHPRVSANLRWKQADSVVFTGFLSSDVPRVLKITSFILTIEENGWKINLPFQPRGSRTISLAPKWLQNLDPLLYLPVHQEEYHSTLVKHRPHHLKVSFHHNSPAYLDEDYPVDIEITNTDERDLDVTISFLLQPTEVDDAINWLIVDDERSSSLIKGIHGGILGPGSSLTKTMHLFNTGAGGDRNIDVSIQTRRRLPNEHDDLDDTAGSDIDEEDEQSQLVDKMEHLNMLVVPTVNPIKVSHDVAYMTALDPWLGVADLRTFEENFWDNQLGIEALESFTMEFVGPWNIIIERVHLERQDNLHAKIVESSTDGADEFPDEFITGDEFCAKCRVSFALGDNLDLLKTVEGPGRYVVTWRRVLQNGTQGPQTISHFLLPLLHPPADNVVALLEVPPKATLHVPTTLTLTIRNCHPTRSANVTVQLEPDSTDSFVISGIRSGRVPVLLPGTEEKLIWRMIPIECGYVKIPRFKVVDRRKAASPSHAGETSTATDPSAGDSVKVIDIGRKRVSNESDKPMVDEEQGISTILVLPR